MGSAKIQLRGHFHLDRSRTQPLSLQIAQQLQDAIEAGRVVRGTRLPATRVLATALGVSRNTVLTAYAELTARGFLRSRRGSGVFVAVSAHIRGLPVRQLLRQAHYPSRTVTIHDPDGNPLCINY